MIFIVQGRKIKTRALKEKYQERECLKVKDRFCLSNRGRGTPQWASGKPRYKKTVKKGDIANKF